MSDTFTIQCPACGAWRTTQDYTVGLLVTCNACGASIRVKPGGDTPPTAATPIAEDFQSAMADPKARAAHDAFAEDSSDPVDTIPATANAGATGRSPTEPAATESADPDRCVRCNREFKGDWDRVTTQNGVICYNCSNLATESLPERLASQFEEPAGLEHETIPHHRDDAEDIGARNVHFDLKSAQFQDILLAAAIATVAIALLVFVTGYGESNVGGGVSLNPDDSEVDIPVWLAVATRIAIEIEVYFTLGLAIFFTFWWRDALPQDTASANILYISGVLGICLGLRVLHGVLWLALFEHVKTGDLWSKFFYAGSVIVSYVLVYRAFDWWFRDLFVFVLAWVLSGFFTHSIFTIIFGGLATLYV